MASKKLSAKIEEEEGSYVSRCPELEVASFGETPEEALENLKEAVVALPCERRRAGPLALRKTRIKIDLVPGLPSHQNLVELEEVRPELPLEVSGRDLDEPGTLQASMTAPNAPYSQNMILQS